VISSISAHNEPNPPELNKVGIKKERIKHKFQEGKKTSIWKSGRKQRELEIVILVNEILSILLFMAT